MPSQLMSTACTRRGVVTTADALAAGLTTANVRGLVRAGFFIPVFRGAYVLRTHVSADGPTLWQRCMAAALLVGRKAVISGATAVALDGIQGGPQSQQIEITLHPSGTRHQRGDDIRLRWGALDPKDVMEIEGLLVQRPLAALREAALDWTREHAVSAFDSALHLGRVRPVELKRLGTESPALEPWIALADGRAESPLETRGRLIWTDGGVPPDFLQHEVKLGGRVIARLDAAWIRPGLKLAVELDGRGPHDQPEALYRDRSRQADLQALGWLVIRVTWDDVIHRPRLVLERVLRELLRVE